MTRSFFLGGVIAALLFSACVCVGSEPETVSMRTPGVVKPKLLHKIDPDYSDDARDAGAQGTVVLRIVVDENGRATDVRILSPLGFGLDEKAVQAVSQWTFTPGMKDGKPVRVMATIEVNFRLLRKSFNEGAERQRTDYNTALRDLNSPASGRVQAGVSTMQELAKKKFAPAMFVFGTLQMSGSSVPKDPESGVKLIRAAAKKKYGPAMYEVGRMYLEGLQGEEKNPGEALKLITDAATRGSRDAQLFLGLRYENGREVPADLSRARRYFRLCAAAGDARCQYRLAKLLIDSPSDMAEAVAWCELAADQGVPEARQLLEAQSAKLSSEDRESAEKLKQTLRHKP